MKLYLIVACSAVTAIAIYFLAIKASPADRLKHELAEIAGPDDVVSLDSCNLSLVVESAGQEGAPIALTRVVVRADLRNYNFQAVRIIPHSKSFNLRIDRGPVNDLMLAQVASIIDAGGDATQQLFSDVNATKELLEAEGSSLIFRVMAEVVVTEEGTQNLIAHEDAPDFFQFAETIESIPAPASYRTTTTFAPGGASAETFLTGEVVAIPFLQFSLGSENHAKKLARAFHDYATANGCG